LLPVSHEAMGSFEVGGVEVATSLPQCYGWCRGWYTRCRSWYHQAVGGAEVGTEQGYNSVQVAYVVRVLQLCQTQLPVLLHVVGTRHGA
jgi:hypothetical protein